MTTNAIPPRPTYSPSCICEHTLTPPDPAKFERFVTWRITKFEPDCPAHGYMFRINLAADLRYGD